MSKCNIRPDLNDKIGFRMSKCDIRPDLNDKIGFRMSKCDIRSEFKFQNRISNVYLVYIYHVFKYIFLVFVCTKLCKLAC